MKWMTLKVLLILVGIAIVINNGLFIFFLQLQLDSIEDGRVVGDPDKATSGRTNGAGTNGDPKAVINGYTNGDHNEGGRLGNRNS